MARYKAIDTSPRFLAVDLEKQRLPGCFDHAVRHLLDYEFDLSLFDARYRNDQSGTCAYRTRSVRLRSPLFTLGGLANLLACRIPQTICSLLSG